MKIIEDQIQMCINSVSPSIATTVLVPNYWLSIDFSRPENVNIIGHDSENMIAYDENGNCLSIMMTAKIII
jgi:hypothetical protein